MKWVVDRVGMSGRERDGFRSHRRTAAAEGQRRPAARRPLRLRAAQALRAGAGGLEPRRCGSNMPSSACSACPSPRSTAASAAAPVETMIVMEAFGRALALEPYLATVVLGGGLLRHGGSEAQQRGAAARRSPRASSRSPSRTPSGSRATTSPTSRPRRGATARGYVLDGEKSVVLHGDSADKLVVTARTAGGRRDRDGIGAVPGRRERRRRVAARLPDAGRAARRRGRRSRTCGSAPEAVLGDAGRRRCRSSSSVVDEAIAALCAEAVGAMDDDARAHRRIPQDPQAVRRADRLVPGAAAPRRRHVRRPRAGAQHGDVRRP